MRNYGINRVINMVENNIPVLNNANANPSAPNIAVWTIADADKVDIFTIENAKTTIFFKFTNRYNAQLLSEVRNLTSLITTFLIKYFKTNEHDYIADFKVFNDPKTNTPKYNLYDLKQMIEVNNDMLIAKKLLELVYEIYDHFAKALGAAIPTARINSKKN